MAKEKRDKEYSAEKKAKKRKTAGGSEIAPPIEASNTNNELSETVQIAVIEKKVVLSPIAHPLADEKLKKKALKLVRSAAKGKHLRRGVKEVVKALRKNTVGLCLIAGDISPIDVITHLPVMCEDRNIPYVYVPSKEELGAAGQTKRPSSCMLLVRDAQKGGHEGEALTQYQELYDQVLKKMKSVQVIY